jgi:hypothetical protein
MTAQPVILGPTESGRTNWNRTIATNGLTNQVAATASMKAAIGGLALARPGSTGYYINEVDENTPRRHMWVGAKGVKGSSRTDNLPADDKMFPIPKNLKTTDFVDKDLICFDPDTGELWECITYQKPILTGSFWATKGLGDRSTKAIKYIEGEAWQKLPWRSASAQISGLPKSPLLLRRDALVSGAHAIGLALPQKNILGDIGSAASVTGEASYTDGKVMNPKTPHVKMGQVLALPQSFSIPSRWGTYTKQLAAIIKAKGLYVVMSTGDDAGAGKLLIQAGEFADSTADRAKWVGINEITFNQMVCVG